jgi:hypothetical protein
VSRCVAGCARSSLARARGVIVVSANHGAERIVPERSVDARWRAGSHLILPSAHRSTFDCDGHRKHMQVCADRNDRATYSRIQGYIVGLPIPSPPCLPPCTPCTTRSVRAHATPFIGPTVSTGLESTRPSSSVHYNHAKDPQPPHQQMGSHVTSYAYSESSFCISASDIPVVAR